MKKVFLIVLLLAGLLATQLVAQNSVIITTNPSPATICVGSSINLTAVKSGGIVLATGYAWSTGQTGSIITVSPLVPTTYTVTVTFSTGIPTTATATVTVTVNPIPTPLVTVDDASICEGDDATLTSTISGQWYQNGTLIPGAIGTSYLTDEAGSYVVSVTVGGCTGESAGTAVTVNPLPDAGFTPNIELEECSDGITPFVANLTGPNYTYQWYRSVNPINGSNPGNDISGATSASYLPALQNLLNEETYYYSLTITNTMTGCSSSW